MAAPCPNHHCKLAKPISKGNKTWRRVNKLAHRLRNKGVPAPIVDTVDSVSQLTLSILATMDFQRGISVQQMSALAKIQSIQVLTLNLDYRMDVELRKKESELTETSERGSDCWAKENEGSDGPERGYLRPQEAQAVFE